MSEPGLSITRSELQTEVQHFLNCDSSTADKAITRGLRRFYNPPAVPPQYNNGIPIAAGYNWSFLHPTETMTLWTDVSVTAGTTVDGSHSDGYTTITTDTGVFYPSMVGRYIAITDTGSFQITAYTSSANITVKGNAECSGKTYSISSNGTFGLPDDFGALENGFLYTSTDVALPRIIYTGEQRVREKRQVYSNSGTPEFAAIRPYTLDDQQRWEVLVNKDPSSNREVSYQYSVLPDNLGASNTRPYGGAAHSETLLEACLAAAESRFKDTPGIHHEQFIKCLAGSINYDKRMSTPSFFGYNGNRGGEPYQRHRTLVTYNGEDPDG